METTIEPLLMPCLPLNDELAEGESTRIETRHGPVQVVSSARQIPRQCWTRALATHGKDHRFYEVIEETLPRQFEYRYFVLKNAQTGAVAIQSRFCRNSVSAAAAVWAPSRNRSAMRRPSPSRAPVIAMTLLSNRISILHPLFGCLSGARHHA